MSALRNRISPVIWLAVQTRFLRPAMPTLDTRT
jgi:hypothetical protein